MAIPTSRTSEKAEIIINTELCNGCGLCVSICSDSSLEIVDKKASVSNTPHFGCIGCGHCMAICPNEAIHIQGRETSFSDLFKLTDSSYSADYNSLLNLLNRRRSIREFKKINVEQEYITKILEAARTAPMGLPPSDVNVLIFDTPEKVRSFSEDFCHYLKGMKWLVSPWFLALMRPFWTKETRSLFKDFIRPLFKVYIESMDKGKNMVTYDAPLAMYFYASPYADPADPIIAASYAMLAGESLGLGTCMLGAIHPMIQAGNKAAKFRAKHGIKCKSREGVFVIFGHPKLHFSKGIKRTFASEKFY